MVTPLMFGRQADGPGWQLRQGRQELALAAVECDAMIFDAPYSDVTHDGSGRAERYDGRAIGLTPGYEHLAADDVLAIVRDWHPRCRGWMVSITDDVLIPAWKAAYRAVGRVAFAALPIVISGMTCRMSGDGPPSWAIYAMVSRPRKGCDRKGRRWSAWATTERREQDGAAALRGAYVGKRVSGAGGGRGKPEWLMRALVADYSLPGDVVVDPFAGWGTTLRAAAELGRFGLGAEMEPKAFDEAVRRLNAPVAIKKPKRPRTPRAPQIEMFRNAV